MSVKAMSDELFQQRVLLEFGYLKTKLNECPTRSEMNAEFAKTNLRIDKLRAELTELKSEVSEFRTEVRASISHLRITTAQGFESSVKLVRTLKKRVDRVDRYLGL